ncbi:MAG: hypothetical protein FJ109_06140 [Deltaproteobacteria bacterium]|nr:hypothetical protein [Deltaproteobacteria bacterium]
MADGPASISFWLKVGEWLRRVVVGLAVVAFLGAILLLLAALFFYQSGYRPMPRENLDVEAGEWAAAGSSVLAEDRLRILSLDLDYGAGAVGSRPEDAEVGRTDADAVTATLDRLAALALERSADVLVLQRVDFGSEYAGNVDQAGYLARKMGWGYVVRSRIWKHSYLPFPNPLGGEMLGHVDLGHAIVSRIPVIEAARFALPPVRLDNWWMTTFAPAYNVAGAVLLTRGRQILVFDAALTCGDLEVREAQAREVAQILNRESTGNAVLALSLCAPPRDLKATGKGRLDYSLDLVRYRRNLQTPFADRDALLDGARWGTHVLPDGTLAVHDYLLPEKGYILKSFEVLAPEPPVSSHRPLLLEVAW